MVIDREDSQAGQDFRCEPLVVVALANRISQPKVEGQRKGGALTKLAGHGQISPHQLRKIAANLQAKSRATIGSRHCGRALSEGGEKARHCLWGDSHTLIPHGDEKGVSILVLGVGRHVDNDDPRRSELDGVGKQIVENLTHAIGIADQPDRLIHLGRFQC